MLFDLSATVRRLSTNSYTVTRLELGSIVNGRYVDGAPSTFDIVASIQPTTPQDLLRLPEGLRTKDSVTIWTDTLLRMALAPSGYKADVVEYQGQAYEVQTIWNWAESGEFYKAVAQKVGQ